MRIHLPEVVVLTGASSGLGKHLANVLLDDGCVVVGVDVVPTPEELDGRDTFRSVSGSVDSATTWDAVKATLDELPGRSIGLASVAATLVQGSAAEISAAEWRRAFDVNVIGPGLAIKHLQPEMTRRGGGPMVFVGSVDATYGEEGLVAYCASKGALRQVVRASALDFGRSGIRCTMVSPGPMTTEMFYKHLNSSPDPEALLATRVARQPLGAITSPEDVANVVAFLLSDQAKGVSGVDVIVDGGLTSGYEFRNIPMDAGSEPV
ncbi:SDR family NAD(P)-dependent oxidoreductase [Nocardioides mesophilus]|uniref:SDR family oxidoreductase n=1 Tax=Nocardioides mesophilus TaxID=433659 RepID=A0A7G9RFL5_9ACTN|nr:SDR family oxidoreductase [Nocardioides mesophilus]QNN54390.1 SDR family oxidoreductase [Nocardioides mesophilus]